MSLRELPALSRVIFGAMSYPGRSRSEQLRVLHCAIDHGITSIDTAPLYDAGESERIVGDAIADRRDSVQILTKCGLYWDDDYGQAMFTMSVGGDPRIVRKDSRPHKIASGIEESLRRLRVETIDLLQIHHLDTRTPLNATLEALEAAKQAGKIRAIGISNFPLREVTEAHSFLNGSLYSIQDRFNMLDRAHSAPIRSFADKAGLAFLAYSPLAQGVLAGKYVTDARRPADFRANASYLLPGNLRRINALISRYAVPTAKAHDTSVAAVCLAWTLAQPGVTGVVAGASTEAQCIENASAARFELADGQLSRFADELAACRIRNASSVTALTRQVIQRVARAVRRLQGR